MKKIISFALMFVIFTSILVVNASASTSGYFSASKTSITISPNERMSVDIWNISDRFDSYYAFDIGNSNVATAAWKSNVDGYSFAGGDKLYIYGKNIGSTWLTVHLLDEDDYVLDTIDIYVNCVSPQVIASDVVISSVGSSVKTTFALSGGLPDAIGVNVYIQNKSIASGKLDDLYIENNSWKVPDTFTGINPGTTAVTIEFYDDSLGKVIATKTINIIVKSKVTPAKQNKVKKLKLNATKKTLKVKKSFVIKTKITPANAKNKKLKFVSTKPKVAKVNSKGKITALKKGSCYIKVMTTDGSKLVKKIKIKVR